MMTTSFWIVLHGYPPLPLLSSGTKGIGENSSKIFGSKAVRGKILPTKELLV
jgi:hypothetical protein